MWKVDQLADAAASLRTVRIAGHRCLAHLSPHSPCAACSAICPEGAMEPGPRFAADRCAHCGLCAAACPGDAILMDDPSDQELLHRFAALAGEYDRLTIGCKAAAVRPLVSVTCLTRLSPELLLAAVACGFESVALVRPPSCGGCRYQAGSERADTAVTLAMRTLEPLGRSHSIIITDSPIRPDRHRRRPTVQAPVHESRRAFLLAGLGLLREAIPFTPKPEPTAVDHRSGSGRRQILSWALSQIAPAQDHPLSWADLAWRDPSVRLTATCHNCGVCQHLCPNGALSASPDGLAIQPDRCTGCGLCIRVCPTAALGEGPPWSLSALTDTTPLHLGSPFSFTCGQCGSTQEGVAAPTAAEAEPICLTCAIQNHSREVFADD